MAWSGTGNVRAGVVMTAVTVLLVVLSLAFQRRADLPARSPLGSTGWRLLRWLYLLLGGLPVVVVTVVVEMLLERRPSDSAS
jgi:hypothetical protein